VTSKSHTVIIVAGGKGERMQQAIPKQFLPLHHQPVLMHTIRLFHRYDANCHIIVVLPTAQLSTWQHLCNQYNFSIPHAVVKGGESRFFSVRNGLSVSSDEGLIGVHDGVRPLVSFETIEACFQKAELCGAAIPVCDAVESLRQLTENGSVAVDRTQFKLVQTPQVFDASLLKQAYQQDFSPFFTDDATVVEAFGCKVELVQGNPENIKITTPGDLRIAEALLTKD
jgi:2-C-methyl-D-erythritol 4-phosphate cytidylyltransferase